jgi:hypothetical protein
MISGCFSFFSPAFSENEQIGKGLRGVAKCEENQRFREMADFLNYRKQENEKTGGYAL